MTLEQFVSQGWADHAEKTDEVAARLPEGLGLVTEAKHLGMLAALIVHVYGEHLARWADGVALLEKLETLPVFDATTPVGKSVVRSKAVLHRCAGNYEDEAKCMTASMTGGDVPEASDRIRQLAIAGSALAFQHRMDEARRDLDECVALAAYGPSKDDPAARSLAMTAHNVAVEFENKPELTDDERALMLRAAQISLDFWKIAGGWMEEERAEYRVTMSHLKAGDAAGALAHAESCLRIVEANGADPYEAFFAREAVAKARLAAGDVDAARTEREAMNALLPTIADEENRAYAAGELAKLDAAIEPPKKRAPRPPKPSPLKSPWK
jgi:hypothetical protein